SLQEVALLNLAHPSMRTLPTLFLLLCLLMALLPAANAYSSYDSQEDTGNLLRVLQRIIRRRSLPNNVEREFNEFSAPAKRHARIGGTIVMGRRK
ncbi:hypothetical protein PFISCL1PPCAC_968, partial [Pristionchus fissidentatus]